MWRHPALRELLWEAYVGARGWLAGVAAVGMALLSASVALSGSAEPRAIFIALFLPLLAAAIMGSTELGAYRVRHNYGSAKGYAVRIFLAAVVWNMLLAACALVVDRAVVHYGLLPREPFAFPSSLFVAAGVAVAIASLSVWPRRGPQ
jgi:hypothetical protein